MQQRWLLARLFVCCLLIPSSLAYFFGDGKNDTNGDGDPSTTPVFTDTSLPTATTTTITTTEESDSSGMTSTPSVSNHATEMTSPKPEVKEKAKKPAKPKQGQADLSTQQYGVLHTDALRLQRHMESCPYCLRRQMPTLTCPLHQTAVEIGAWSKALGDTITDGCPMGPTDREKCCLNGDATVQEMLRDLRRRLRDLYHVLEMSCDKCPKPGGYSEWSQWEPCSVTCGSGTRVRTRSCTNPSPSNGGKNCEGRGRETARCYPAPSPVNGDWSQWGVWSRCSATCGAGTRQRIRTCSNPPPNVCGQKCPGEDKEMDNCRVKECCAPIHGNWNSWGQWSQCSATCGVGNRERVRSCTNPAPNSCGDVCPDSYREQIGCYKDCCLDGAWGQWDPWSHCSATCGSNGVKVRSRKCDSPEPNWCGKKCPGDGSDTTPCNCKPCCGPAVWDLWSPWSTCSTRSGQCQRSRSRRCLRPAGSGCQEDCLGPPIDRQVCDSNDCCGPAVWDLWSPWSTCSTHSGRCQRSRSRRCLRPAASGCQEDCLGPPLDRQECDNNDCCVPDIWSSWGPWQPCSVTCGGGTSLRSRTCIASRSNPCRQGCAGGLSRDTEFRQCGKGPCCEPEYWSSWGQWSQCSATCGRGRSTRSRECKVSRSNPCYTGCLEGGKSEMRDCQDSQCCGWSPWSQWTGCSITCGPNPGRRTRTRNCVSSGRPCTIPGACPGRSEEIDICPVLPCPPPANWGTWDPWCPCNCRSGVTSRRRECLSGGRRVDTSQCQREEDGGMGGGGWGRERTGRTLSREEEKCDIRAENCPVCIMDCRGKTNGNYSVCFGCSYYLQCQDGHATVHRCSLDHEWDDHNKRCVSPPSETCSLQEEAMTSCQGRHDGSFHTGSDCRRFIRCSQGQGREDVCGYGQEFNAHSERCEFERSPTCVRRIVDQNIKEQYQRFPQVLQRASRFQNMPQNDGALEKVSSTPAPLTQHFQTEAPQQGSSPLTARPSEQSNGSKTEEEADVVLTKEKLKQHDPGTSSDVRLRHGGKRHHKRHRHHGSERHQGNGGNQAYPCHSSCEGLERGRRYASCQGCRFYLVCPLSNPQYIRRCPGNKEWDAEANRCKESSATCQRDEGNEIPLPETQGAGEGEA